MKRQPKAKLNIDNKGMSLVELIISLLIIAVVFTPLIMTFTQAMKVERITNVRSYADDAAQNAIETIKSKGVVDYAKWFEAEKAKGNIEGNAGGTYVTYESLLGANTDVKSYVWPKQPSPTLTYTYTLENVTQGTQTYDLSISISAAKYKNLTSTPVPTVGAGTPTPTAAPTGPGMFNDYVFADFSAFSSKNTVLIYPKTSNTLYVASVGAGTPTPTAKIYPGFDGKAVQYFMDKNEEYKDSIYIADREASEERNAVIKAWNRDNPDSSPTPAVTYPVRRDAKYAAASSTDIKNSITRSITIEIAKNTVDDGERVNGRGYTVSSSVCYTANNTAKLYSADTSDKPTVTYQGYATDVYLDKLDSIFFLYLPSESGITDYIYVDNKLNTVSGADAGKKIDLYIAYQTEDVDPTYPAVKVVESSDTDRDSINYYSQGEVRLSNNLGATRTENNGLVKDMANSSNRIFVIEVNVYEAGTTNLVSTMSSTFVNDTEIR